MLAGVGVEMLRTEGYPRRRDAAALVSAEPNSSL